MKKRVITLLMTALMTTGLFVGCTGGDKASKLKVGMVTDAGTIDDKSFNQGTWEGILKAKEDLGISEKYLKPDGETHTDYIGRIKDLNDGGYKFIVSPGFKFETAIYEAQSKYPDCKFVLIDASPNNGKQGAEFKSEVAKNTVSIFFAEEQSGFLAGVATSLQLKTGDLGFIGGMEIPPVQKFNWGFQQGVKYANENLGTNMTIKEENVKYQGTFTSPEAGQQIAATMYDRGVKAIFVAAGGTGSGAMTEAKARAKSGKEAWIVGVDMDQYADGEYETGKSVVLTSAMKKINKASYDMIKAELDGTFPGGKTLVYDAKVDGVGLPEKNPNLNEEVIKKTNEVYEKIKSEEIKVSKEQGNLLK